MKALLAMLAALALVGLLANSLLTTTTPLTRMRLRKEAVVKVDRPDGQPAVAQAAPAEQSPTVFESVERSILGAAAKAKSWLGQGTSSSPTPSARLPSTFVGIPDRDPNVVTITRDISIHIQYGIIGLRRGTRVTLISRDGQKVQVRDSQGATLLVPVSATDLE